jgi:hypothetical protein
MKQLLIGIGILWVIGSAAVPMLQSWDMGSSIDSMGTEQIVNIEEK